MDRIRHFVSHRLVQRNRPRMALNWMMLLLFALLAVQLFAFALPLFTLAMREFLLAVTLEQLALSGVSLAFPIDGLGRWVLHRRSDTRQRVTGSMRRS